MIATDASDELDAVLLWQFVRDNPAPRHQAGTRRRLETVCGLNPGGNKKSVMGVLPNPNISQPAHGVGLVSGCVVVGANGGNGQPSTELQLIAQQPPHAESHARAPDQGVVHSLTQPAWADEHEGDMQLCNCALQSGHDSNLSNAAAAYSGVQNHVSAGAPGTAFARVNP